MCAWSHMCAWSCCSDTLTMYHLAKQPRASPCRGLAFHEVVLLCSLSFSPVQSIITLSSFETAKHCALPARCKPLVKWPGAYRNVQDKTVHCKLPGPGTDRYGERERRTTRCLFHLGKAKQEEGCLLRSSVQPAYGSMGFIVLWVLSWHWHSELQNVAATQLCLRNLKLWTLQSRVLHLQVRRRVAKVHVVEVQVANAANSPPPAPAPIKPPKTPVKTPAAKQPAMKLPAKTLPPKARMYRVAVSTCHHL